MVRLQILPNPSPNVFEVRNDLAARNTVQELGHLVRFTFFADTGYHVQSRLNLTGVSLSIQVLILIVPLDQK